MIIRIIPLLFFLSFINGQIALPTFQAVHKPHSTSSSSGTFTFTNCNATGNNGPTQSQVNSAYSGISLDGDVTINTQGIQEWTVPTDDNYTIEVWGAGGGSTNYGAQGGGTKIKGNFDLLANHVLKIIVGQLGTTHANNSGGGPWTGYSSADWGHGGGGGGSYNSGSNEFDSSTLGYNTDHGKAIITKN
jgi:hypothetical protein